MRKLAFFLEVSLGILNKKTHKRHKSEKKTKLNFFINAIANLII